jgi:hypothetical protein
MEEALASRKVNVSALAGESHDRRCSVFLHRQLIRESLIIHPEFIDVCLYGQDRVVGDKAIKVGPR